MPSTLAEQFNFIGSISNDHQWDYLHVRDEGTKSNNTYVGFGSHIAGRYQTYIRQSEDTEAIFHTFLPTSPRNRLIYFISMGRRADALRLLQYLTHPPVNSQDNLSESTDIPLKRRRVAGPKVVKVTQETLTSEVEVEVNRSQFQQFSENIILRGSIIWRSHNDSADTFILNDYDVHSGEFIPNSFVELNVTRDTDTLECSCKSYSFLVHMAEHAGDYLHEQSLVLNHSSSSSLTCMHCVFYNNYLRSCIENNSETITHPATHVEMKVVKDKINDGVVILGSPPPGATIALSVSGKVSRNAFVHITVIILECNTGS